MGVLETTSIYEQADPIDVLELEVLCAEGSDLLRELSRERIPEHADFLLEAGQKEHTRGWAGLVCDKDDIDAHLGENWWAPYLPLLSSSPLESPGSSTVGARAGSAAALRPRIS